MKIIRLSKVLMKITRVNQVIKFIRIFRAGKMTMTGHKETNCVTRISAKLLMGTVNRIALESYVSIVRYAPTFVKHSSITQGLNDY